MQIRRLQTEEIPQAVSLCRYVYSFCLAARVKDPSVSGYFDEFMTEESLAGQTREEKLFLWGCFENGQLAGAAGMFANGLICMLYVHPDFQNRKYGRRLLMEMRKFAAVRLGLKRVTVNATPAWTARFFEQCGFRQTDFDQNLNSPYMNLTARSVYLRDYPVQPLPRAGVIGLSAGALVLCTALAAGYAVWTLF